MAVRAGVQILAGCDAVGLASAGRGQRVTGVTILPRQDGAASSVLPADLVVDATGRSSRAPLWMAELGYHGPAEEQCGLGASFASRLYRREPGRHTAPKTIAGGALAAEAVGVMERLQITSLFVLADGTRRPAGVIHLHDLLRAGVV